MRLLLASLLVIFTLSINAQNYWQQRVDYTMDITMNDELHQFDGKQKLVYHNESPNELSKVYYHLYFNAFQPGSMMDIWSQTVEDPDPRVGNRIANLDESEIGFIRVNSLKQNGTSLEYVVRGTILEVSLNKPIAPGKKATFEMDFKGQVPVQIRRSGRDNKEGVAYSMTQWYPKMCEFDVKGWHADPYIGREFHGVWGDFDVTIHIDSAYTIGGTGVLQNPKKIGHGYAEPGDKLKRPEGDMLSWNFKAENVHDFAWAADKNYVHTKFQMEDGLMLHFIYKDEPDLKANWEKLPAYTMKCFEYANEHFGQYPWPQFTVIQGGDGGMEYPMTTLITGKRKLGSLVGTTVHEIIHEWFQSILASNEGLYSWMDEGFNTFASNKIMAVLFDKDEDTRIGRYYDSYYRLAASGKEEPLSQMSDHFRTFYAFSGASYSKGAVFMAQLGYVLGNDVMMAGLYQYFEDWKMKHPTPTDVTRVMEEESGIHLKWYQHYMVNTVAQIDYGIEEVIAGDGMTEVLLRNYGEFPMPLDINVTYKDGTKEVFNIPLVMMNGAKMAEDNRPFIVLEAWPWTNPTYTLIIPNETANIARIEIDESMRLADVNRANNLVLIE